MPKIQTPHQAHEEAEIHQTGGWYIAELDNPQLVVQGESESDARQKIAKRWEEYTAESDKSDKSDKSDIQLGSSNSKSDRDQRKLTPPQF